jgi:predicted GIY-YIG superfamily endonuclease
MVQEATFPSAEKGQHWVYVLRCTGDHLYIGSSGQLRIRLQALAMGKGVYAVTRRLPFTLLAACPCTDGAMTFELYKQMSSYSALQVIAVIQGPAWISGIELIPYLSVGEDARSITAEK